MTTASLQYQIQLAATSEECARFRDLPDLPSLSPALLARQHPDERWLLTARGTGVARCSLWWTQALPHEGQRVGVIGHYAARDAEAAARILDHAIGRLHARGCTLAVGPMDGNTWQNYRLVTERGVEAPFFLEPANPDDWARHFEAAGFAAIAHYYSALNEHLDRDDPAAPAIAGSLALQNVTLRPLRLEDLAFELCRLHALSLECFKDGLFFAPIRQADFLAQYQELRPYVVSDLILLAERAGQLLGYVFAVPDWLQARRGEPVDTFIIKTLAVHPEWHGAGLGRLLAARCHVDAHALGYRRAIHALMVETSAARRLSDPIARPIRRYALFARPLGGNG